MKSSRRADNAHKGPARFEIAQLVLWVGKLKFPVLDRHGQPTFDRKGQPNMYEANGCQFWLSALGPKGKYNAGESEPFQAKTGADRVGTWVEHTKESRKAFDDLVAKAWQEGWQPTSFGHFWHDVHLRRTVPEPVDTAAEEAEAFRRVAAKYTKIRADFAAARLNPEKYRAAVQKLTLEDSSGRHWMIDGQSGRWLVFDGENWKPGEPPCD